MPSLRVYLENSSLRDALAAFFGAVLPKRVCRWKACRDREGASTTTDWRMGNRGGDWQRVGSVATLGSGSDEVSPQATERTPTATRRPISRVDELEPALATGVAGIFGKFVLEPGTGNAENDEVNFNRRSS
jgi:hypothetical protein